MLSTAAATTAKTIRYYEQAGLLPAPARTASGYRDYPPQAVKRLAFIRTARTAGLTLAEIREILAIRDRGQPPCARVAAMIGEHLAEVDRRIAELRQARAALCDLARRAAVTSPEECADEHICRILTTSHTQPAGLAAGAP